MKSIDKFVAKGRHEDDIPKAKETAGKVVKYGKEQLEAAKTNGEEGYYADGMQILAMLEKSFKGHEIGDEAKELLSKWKKDSTVKAERQAGTLLEQASGLIRQKKFQAANAVLQRILHNKKFDGLKTRERAQQKLQSIKDYVN